jgi:formylglycine-generating enzyme required for sulfatase activity
MSGLASVVTSPLDACVGLAPGRYRLGDEGQAREATIAAVAIGRYPVVNEHYARFVAETGRDAGAVLAAKLADPQLADHPVTDVTFADAQAFCAWAGGRLPTGAEWEAAARGTDRRPWPWGEVFDPELCACVESGWGWTAPVTRHPDGAAPCGCEQMAGNVWEWVDDATEEGAWRAVRGGSYLDHAWGVCAARALAADPDRATATTGFRLVIDPERRP